MELESLSPSNICAGTLHSNENAVTEIFKLKYAEDRIRELYIELDTCKDFTEFFIKVCQLKVEMDVDDLKILLEVVSSYTWKFNRIAIVYLKDCVSTEIILPCKSKEAYEQIERDMRREIVNNFKELFPDYKFQCIEKIVDGIGRIDIFATSNERPVIMELKTGRKNPNGQLIAYASMFDNPILIAINQNALPKEKQKPGIKYLVFEEMKKSVSQ